MAEDGSGGRGKQRESPNDEPEDRNRNGVGRFTFRLPPIRLPPLFPDVIHLGLPVPGFRGGRRVSSAWVLVVCLGFDLFDAGLALTASGPVDVVRTVGGTAIAVVVADWVGLLYLWEVVAVLFGFATVTVVPTLGALVLYRVALGRA